jgi:hypothetical protein
MARFLAIQVRRSDFSVDSWGLGRQHQPVTGGKKDKQEKNGEPAEAHAIKA